MLCMTPISQCTKEESLPGSEVHGMGKQQKKINSTELESTVKEKSAAWSKTLQNGPKIKSIQ